MNNKSPALIELKAKDSTKPYAPNNVIVYLNGEMLPAVTEVKYEINATSYCPKVTISFAAELKVNPEEWKPREWKIMSGITGHIGLTESEE